MNQTKVKQDGLIPLYVRPSIIADDLAFIDQGNDYIVVTREGARKLRKTLKKWLKENDHE